MTPYDETESMELTTDHGDDTPPVPSPEEKIDSGLDSVSSRNYDSISAPNSAPNTKFTPSFDLPTKDYISSSQEELPGATERSTDPQLKDSQASQPNPHSTLITIVETVYYNAIPPLAIETRLTRQLLSSEQPYVRHTQAGPQWQPIDRGWLEQVSLLVVKNTTQKPSNTSNPAMPIVLEIGYEPASEGGRTMFSAPQITTTQPLFYLLPGDSIRFSPIDLGQLRLRCPNGMCRLTLNIFGQ